MNDPGSKTSRSGRILILIPCHNEQGRIGHVIGEIRKSIPAADIAVIDDCSSDGSAIEAAAGGAKVLPLCTNLGYGAALETGYLYAVRKGYDIVLQMDGDGQHRADQFPALLRPIQEGEADMVIGSRYMSNSARASAGPVRRLGHKVFAGIIFTLSGMRITDPTSGFQALNNRALELFASGNFPCDFPDSDVILMAKMSGLRIREVPAIMQERSGGESMHSGLKPVYYSIKMLLAIAIVLLNRQLWMTWRRKLPGESLNTAHRKETS